MKTILIVEDELAIADMLAAMLEDEGYQVLTADNGREGLSCLSDARPALVICDVMMPILDGRQMCRTMRSSPEYRTIPFVLMSAASEYSATSECDFTAFLSKPFDLYDVLTLVEQLAGPPGVEYS